MLRKSLKREPSLKGSPLKSVCAGGATLLTLADGQAAKLPRATFSHVHPTSRARGKGYHSLCQTCCRLRGTPHCPERRKAGTAALLYLQLQNAPSKASGTQEKWCALPQLQLRLEQLPGAEGSFTACEVSSVTLTPWYFQ